MQFAEFCIRLKNTGRSEVENDRYFIQGYTVRLCIIFFPVLAGEQNDLTAF